MADETDGVGETFDDSLRIALTIASQFAERTTRLREQFARQREASAQQEYRELHARFESERGAARASLAPVHQPEWWDTAKAEDIAAAHETASVWREHDDVARDVGDTIRRQVQDRYGVDVDAPNADPAVVASVLRDAERDRADARAERKRSGEELTATQLLFATADRRERDARDAAERGWAVTDVGAATIGDVQEPATSDGREEIIEAASDAGAVRTRGELAYDSSERRQRFAASLEGKADQKTIDARILADGENARHPCEAVLSQTGRSSKPRNPAKGVVQERTRGGLAR